VGSVLDAADVEHAIVGVRAEYDAVASAPGHTPAFKLEAQRFGHRVRIGRQRGSKKLDDGSRHPGGIVGVGLPEIIHETGRAQGVQGFVAKVPPSIVIRDANRRRV